MVTLRTFSELDLCISHQPSADFSGTERKKRKKIRRKKNATWRWSEPTCKWCTDEQLADS